MNLHFFISRNINHVHNTLSKDDNISNSFRKELQEQVTTLLQKPQSKHAEFTLDRFQGDFAVLENRTNGQMIDVPIGKIPSGVAEGSILRYENNIYIVDHELTEKSRIEIRDLMKELRGQ